MNNAKAKPLECEIGDTVVAIQDLTDVTAGVVAGTFGVVFAPTNFYGDGAGPMVRFVNGGVCNVYEGWVAKVKLNPEELTFFNTLKWIIGDLYSLDDKPHRFFNTMKTCIMNYCDPVMKDDTLRMLNLLRERFGTSKKQCGWE